jgi:hypothetical protein
VYSHTTRLPDTHATIIQHLSMEPRCISMCRAPRYDRVLSGSSFLIDGYEFTEIFLGRRLDMAYFCGILHVVDIICGVGTISERKET